MSVTCSAHINPNFISPFHAPEIGLDLSKSFIIPLNFLPIVRVTLYSDSTQPYSLQSDHL